MLMSQVVTSLVYKVDYTCIRLVWPARPIPPLPFYMLRFICEGEDLYSNSCYIPFVLLHDNTPNVVLHGCRYVNSDAVVHLCYEYIFQSS